MPAELAAVDVEEHLGAKVDPELVFQSSDGATVKMGDLLVGDVPTLLTLNYFTCETLCSLQLNAVLDGLRALDWVPGQEFRVVTVSIDPKEDAALAASKRDTYLQSLGKGDGVEWHFLTGEQEAITSLADTVGFRYSYDERTGQYAHPAVIAFISPEGDVARYVYGVQYTAMDLKFALMEAAAGRVGSPAERLILSCFRYDETVGKYTPFAFGIMRIGGLVTMVFLGFAGIVLWRREWTTRGHGSES
jgi:protein SCO1/2